MRPSEASMKSRAARLGLVACVNLVVAAVRDSYENKQLYPKDRTNKAATLVL